MKQKKELFLFVLAVLMTVVVFNSVPAQASADDWDVVKTVCQPRIGTRAYKREIRREKRMRARRAGREKACSSARQKCKAASRKVRGIRKASAKKRAMKLAKRTCVRSIYICRGPKWARVSLTPCKPDKKGFCGVFCQAIRHPKGGYYSTGFARPRRGEIHCATEDSYAPPFSKFDALRERGARKTCAILSGQDLADFKSAKSELERRAIIYSVKTRIWRKDAKFQTSEKNKALKQRDHWKQKAQSALADLHGQQKLTVSWQKKALAWEIRAKAAQKREQRYFEMAERFQKSERKAWKRVGKVARERAKEARDRGKAEAERDASMKALKEERKWKWNGALFGGGRMLCTLKNGCMAGGDLTLSIHLAGGWFDLLVGGTVVGGPFNAVKPESFAFGKLGFAVHGLGWTKFHLGAKVEALLGGGPGRMVWGILGDLVLTWRPLRHVQAQLAIGGGTIYDDVALDAQLGLAVCF